MGNVARDTLEYTYSRVTESIRVSVICQPMLGNSDPRRNVFAFAYTITIDNLGQETSQLLERHWLIKSASSQVIEVVGPGVVGQQPFLIPGETFQYSSGAVIQDPVGWMEGAYTFGTDEGRLFDVLIPRFELVFPVVVH